MADKVVLIIEDDPSFSEAVADLLKSKSYKSLRCAKLVEAQMKLKNQKFDLILLDLKIEGGSGEQIVTYLKANPKGFNFDTPILVVSGTLDTGIVKRLGPSVNGVLTKPLDPQKLVAKLEGIAASAKPKL